MPSWNRWHVVGGVILTALAVAAPVRAVAPEIKDEAKFFTPDAIKKANKEIRDLARKYDKDLLIETFPTVPGDHAERVKNMTGEERGKFFYNWANDRAEAAVVNGIYILICKEPARLEIIITRKARSTFDKEAFAKLRELLLRQFRDKHYDAGLSQAVDFVRERWAGTSR